MSETSKKSHPKVKVIKDFRASPQKVFDAWLDPSIISHWMFGPDVRDEEIIKLETNPEKNGKFSFVVRRGDDVINHVGTYLEINRPERLIFTWGIEGESEEESVVSIGITSTKNGCRLTLVHENVWTEYVDRTKAGWTFMLEKLKTIAV
ncbi:MAG TPA: SRPBCC domain-containing protein [Balneolaceae bacterium]